jgi:hypothetical protein
LVGEGWQRLPEAVHNAHLTDDLMEARAVFRVSHGQSWLARCMAWLARLPAQSDAAPVRLAVHRVEGGERWERAFPNTRLISIQYDAGDGLLGERFGLLDIRFRLPVMDRALVYLQESAALTLGRLRLSIPKWLAPQVTARESTAADGKTPHILVSVSLPLVGLLVEYEGDLNVEGVS